jgi:hypothetical protein
VKLKLYEAVYEPEMGEDRAVKFFSADHLHSPHLRAEAARVLAIAFGEHIAPTRMTRLKNPYR